MRNKSWTILKLCVRKKNERKNGETKVSGRGAPAIPPCTAVVVGHRPYHHALQSTDPEQLNSI